MSKRREQDLAVGQDSFLDTTANLVGILIILVVVVGTQARYDVVEFSKKKLAEAAEESQPFMSDAGKQSQAMNESLVRQAKQLKKYEFENEYRERERNNLLKQVAYAREILEEELATVDEKQKEFVEQAQKVQKLSSELEKVELQVGAAEARERPEIVLEHLPTPMARTVFTKEMHLQLKGKKISVIPWDRLVGSLKTEVPLALRRKSGRRPVEDSLGPVGGFLMHYRMVPSSLGYELDRFELEATGSEASETLAEALAPSGRLSLEMASRTPGETVVTVWVYPDSFEEFRQLKAWMFDEGFLTAARPLPFGVPIGASPQGTRSSAQ